MLSYCFKCRKNTKSKNHELWKTKNVGIMIWLKCVVCTSRKSKIPDGYEKKDKMIKKLFCEYTFKRLGRGKCILLGVKSIKSLKSLKHHIFAIKHYFFIVFVTNVEVKMKKYLKKKNQLKYLKFLA